MTVQANLPGGKSISRTASDERIYDHGNMREVFITAAEDTYIESANQNPSPTRGDDATFKIAAKKSGKKRALLQFDLTSLPVSAKVKDAQLRLYQKNNASNATLDVHTLLRNWSEDDATWRDRTGSRSWSPRGGKFAEAAAASIDSGGGEGWKIGDVTPTVDAWLNKELANYGLLVKGRGNSTNNREFYASENLAYVNRRPNLKLRFYCPCGVSCDMGEPIADIVLTTADSSNEWNGVTFSNKQLVRQMPRKSGVVELLLDNANYGLNKEINALHMLANGNLLLAFKRSGSIAGVDFTPQDIVELDRVAGTAKLQLDGSELGLDKKIQGLTLDANGHLLMTFSGSGSWRGQNFSGGDVLRFDRLTRQVEMVMDASTLGYNAKISALHRRENGKYVLSLESNTSWASQSFEEGKLISYDLATNSPAPYLDYLRFQVSSTITALHVGPGFGELPAIPTAYWPMASASGAAVEEVAGSYDGQRFGGEWAFGGLSGAISLSGTGEYVAVNHSAALAPDSSFSLATYVYLNTASNAQTLISKQAVGGPQYALLVEDGVPRFSIGNTVLSSPVMLQADQWYQLTGVYDAEASQMRLYLDGQLLQQKSMAQSLPAMNNSAPLYFGSNGSGDFLNGYLDDVRFYDEALTVGDISDFLGSPMDPAAAYSSPIPDADIPDASMPISVCLDSYIDDFNDNSGAGSDGIMTWSTTPWEEFGESDGFSAGHIGINNGYLRLRNANSGVMRPVDLSGASSSAQMHLTYRREFLTNSSTYVAVEISADGTSGPFHELVRLKGFAWDFSNSSISVDIGAYASANSVMRIKTSNSMPVSNQVRIYKMELSCNDN
jgi:hypothetical protein